jgi:hypothetical protein
VPRWYQRAFPLAVTATVALFLVSVIAVGAVQPSKSVVAGDVARAPDGTPIDPAAPGAIDPATGQPTTGAVSGATSTTVLNAAQGPNATGGTTGAGPAGAPAAGTATTVAAPVTLKASDVGVTADTIRLGVLIPNLNELAQAGFKVGVPGDARSIADAWAAYTNKRGGILGRKIALFYDVFSVLDVNDMLRACKKLTEDDKVFTVINLGGYDSVAQLCVAKEHKVPLLAGDPQPQGWYQQAAPYLWTTLMNKDRAHKNHVKYLKENGTLKDGNTIGVIYHGIPNVAPSIEQSLLPEMAAEGVKPKIVVKLSEDSNQALNQIPQAVVDMQAAGVKTVFLMMNLIFKTSFIQQADKQQFHPLYTDNDHYFGCYSFTTATYPDSYDKALCVTATNSGITGPQSLSNPKLNQAYVQFADTLYKEAYPEGYKKGGGDNPDDQEAQRALNMAYGTFFLMWQEAATRVGADLTRAKWGVEMGKTGRWDRTVTSPSLSYSATKHDGPDSIALVQWSAAAGGDFKAKQFRQIAPHRPAWF